MHTHARVPHASGFMDDCPSIDKPIAHQPVHADRRSVCTNSSIARHPVGAGCSVDCLERARFAANRCTFYLCVAVDGGAHDALWMVVVLDELASEASLSLAADAVDDDEILLIINITSLCCLRRMSTAVLCVCCLAHVHRVCVCVYGCYARQHTYYTPHHHALSCTGMRAVHAPPATVDGPNIHLNAHDGWRTNRPRG